MPPDHAYVIVSVWPLSTLGLDTVNDTDKSAGEITTLTVLDGVPGGGLEVVVNE